MYKGEEENRREKGNKGVFPFAKSFNIMREEIVFILLISV